VLMTEKLLTVRDVALFLGITEREVLDLADEGTIPAYKIGGVYLRFKREQVEDFRKKMHSPKSAGLQRFSIKDKVIDFFYFNDFYILSLIVIVLMIYIIFRG